jgi:predicted DNA-binding transcriptional regulator AlpA
VEQIVKRNQARKLFAVAESTFDEVIAPRLERVQLTQRAVGFTSSSIDRVMAEMIAEAKTRSRKPTKKRRR